MEIWGICCAGNMEKLKLKEHIKEYLAKKVVVIVDGSPKKKKKKNNNKQPKSEICRSFVETVYWIILDA